MLHEGSLYIVEVAAVVVAVAFGYILKQLQQLLLHSNSSVLLVN